MKARCVSILLIFSALPAKADLITFNFAMTSGTNQAGLDLDGLASGSSTVAGSGFTVTLSASANTGTFNRTASSPDFGINASGSGDDTDAFDDGTGTIEVMTFSFTTSTPVAAISFVSIDFDRITGSGLTGEDAGSLAFVGGSSFNFNASNVSGSDLLSVNEAITAGQVITLAFVDGNGFGLEAITLDVTPADVPEPGPGLPLLAVLFTTGILFHRRSLRTARD